MKFSPRPEIQGTFGVATSTHWIASAVGMRLLEAGGTAFDAAAAMGFVHHVVEPHLCGPLGDMSLMVRPAGDEAPTVVCGQGVAPAAATIAHYRSEGLDMVPGSGLLATVVPGAFDAWMLMLRDHGNQPLRAILEPAIHYARHGHPLLAGVSVAIAELAEFFRSDWPTSAATWLPGGNVPAPGSLFRNVPLAEVWERLLAEAEAASPDRLEQIEAARRVFYEGFVAAEIDDWMRTAEVTDATGERRKGVLTGQDMAGWRASKEAPLSVDYAGWTVWKCGEWSQGPSLLQALRILEGTGVAGVDPLGAEFVHLATESLKLAFADREAYYGDDDRTRQLMPLLLSEKYAATRRRLIGPEAAMAQRPGAVSGLEALAQASIQRAARRAPSGPAHGAGEPTNAHLTQRSGDTVHLDVIDRWGNMVSATPSGGWLQSSPVIPALGMPLNSRAQMFWLDEGLPTSLAPGRRPRTTLTPSMAQSGRMQLCFGTPGGDQQEQWQLAFFLRLVHGDFNLQEAINAPLFHTAHAPASFYPRLAKSGHLMLEPELGEAAIEELRRRGHRVEVAPSWSLGRLTAAARTQDAMLLAAATPRLMQAYAIGR